MPLFKSSTLYLLKLLLNLTLLKLLFETSHNFDQKKISLDLSILDLRVRAVALEDLQHAGAGDVPHLGAELLPVQDDQVLQAVGARAGQLLVVCRGVEREGATMSEPFGGRRRRQSGLTDATHLA